MFRFRVGSMTNHVSYDLRYDHVSGVRYNYGILLERFLSKTDALIFRYDE